MEQNALEVAQAIDIGQLPLVEEASAGDENISLVLDNFWLRKIQSEKLHYPLGPRLIPSSFQTPVTETDMLSDIILLSYSLPIFQHLGGTGVELAPICPRFVAQLVSVGGNI